MTNSIEIKLHDRAAYGSRFDWREQYLIDSSEGSLVSFSHDESLFRGVLLCEGGFGEVVAFVSASFISVGWAGNTKEHHSTKAHRIVIQVDQNDPAVINLALNNATNVIDYYRAKHEDVDVDVVTYGPGLHMLRADTSPVQDRIKHLKDHAFPRLARSSSPHGHPIAILSEAVIVPSGVVRLMELQEKGWSYVRP